MIQRLIRKIREEKGELDGILTFFGILYIMLILTCVGTDFYRYAAIKDNLTLAASEALEIYKAKNIFDDEVRKQFYTFTNKLQLDSSRITVSASPENVLVQRGDPVEITVTRPYQAITSKLIGIDIEVPITVRANGLAHFYVRE